MANIISGKEVSLKVKSEVRAKALELKEKGIEIGLAVVIVGDNPASIVYVNTKKKACEEVGFVSYEYALPEETTEQELLDLINVLNKDEFLYDIQCIIRPFFPEEDVYTFGYDPIHYLQNVN